jgi:hypothetical protein
MHYEFSHVTRGRFYKESNNDDEEDDSVDGDEKIV